MKDSAVFKVIKPGLLTTVQDLGRRGYERFGIGAAGAMDPYALRMANLLAGNEENLAGLEITLQGPVLEVLSDCVIAVTGANLQPRVNGKDIPMWASVPVKKGEIIEFGPLKSGCRTYLAVNGGIDVPLVMGSRSTYLRGNIGGYNGRALKKGDVLEKGEEFLPLKRKRRLAPELIPTYSGQISVRVIEGPQANMFPEKSREKFYTGIFSITPQSDRMGCRLQGPSLEIEEGYEHITDPVPPGSIQVPPDGNPIILLADRQTTGGYAKIATVISVDLPKIAQGKPGDQIQFIKVDLQESHKLLKEKEKLFRLLKLQLRGVMS